MSGFAWIYSFIEHFLNVGDTWFCLFVYDGSRLIGVLPVVERARRPLLRVLERSTPANADALSVGITAKPNREQDVFEALTEALLCERPKAFFANYAWRRLRRMSEQEYKDVTLCDRRSLTGALGYLAGRGKGMVRSAPGAHQIEKAHLKVGVPCGS